MRFRTFAGLSEYQYIGMGSTFFSDFRLFHLSLGMETMYSIEHEVEKQERFDFNRPFQCIEMLYAQSTEVLPGFDWAQPTIAWLDYDDQLRAFMLEDLEIVAEVIEHGSAYCLSANAHPGAHGSARRHKLVESVGEENIPEGVQSDDDLAGSKTADVYREILVTRLHKVLAERNAVLPDPEQLAARELFHFRYRDGAPMLTVGWLFHRDDEATRGQVERTLAGLPQLPVDDTPYEIEVPSLTFKEMRHLDEHLPADDPEEESGFIPEEDRRKYAQLYRFFPSFVDAEVQ